MIKIESGDIKPQDAIKLADQRAIDAINKGTYKGKLTLSDLKVEKSDPNQQLKKILKILSVYLHQIIRI